MNKKLVVISTAFVVAFIGGSIQSTANAQENNGRNQNEKVAFCHATRSATNPYVYIETDSNSIIRQGHGGHDEEAVTSLAEAATVKASGGSWGDIIPSFDGFDGLNLEKGQSVLDNKCVVEGQVPVEQLADVMISAKCTDNAIVVSLSNEGTKSAEVVVNGETFVLTPGGTEEVTFDAKTKLTVTVDGKPVVVEIKDCAPGKGSVIPKNDKTPVTPATTPAANQPSNVAALPYTAGNSTVATVATVSAVATAVAAISFAVKVAYRRFI